MEVLLRPENVVLDARGEPGTADGVTARVTSTSFLGNLRRSEVELPDGARVHVQHPAVVVIAVVVALGWAAVIGGWGALSFSRVDV